MFKKLLPLFYALGMTGLVILTLVNFTVFDSVELTMLDFRYFFRESEDYVQKHSPQNIDIVAIDQKSLEIIGKWPWRRLYYSRLIERLVEEKAKVIFFDLFLISEDNNNPEDDQELLSVVQKAGNVYFDFPFDIIKDEYLSSEQMLKRQEREAGVKRFGLPYADPQKIFTRYNDRYRVMAPPFPALVQVVRGTGSAYVEPDDDSILRKTPLFTYYQGQLYPNIALQIYLDLIGKKVSDIKLDIGHISGENWVIIGDKVIPVDYRGRMLINFIGRKDEAVTQISYCDILNKNKDVQVDLEDKIIMISPTVKGMMYDDIKVTPLGPMSGIETIATTLQNLQKGEFIRRVPNWIDYLVIFGLSLLTGLVLIFCSPLISAIITIIVMLGFIGVSLYVFNQFSIWIAVVAPLSSSFLTFTAATVHHVVLEQREKRRIRNTFSRYVSPDVVEEILKHPEKLNLGGEKKELTILFSDIRDFTTWSESLPADTVVGQLNEYLDAMTECVYDNGGMVDKYIGDAIMALFGSPLPRTDSAQLACKTALKMMETLRGLHQKWEKEGRPLLRIGIGINTGEVVAGNIGSQKVMNYTVIGDAVNLASRLESANKEYGTGIIISDFTYQKVKAQAIVRELGEVKVKGRLQAVKVYELTGWHNQPAP